MDLIQKWAVTEMVKLMPGGLLEESEVKQMVGTFINLDSASINAEISGLLDFSQKEVKKFIKEFIDKIEGQRRYEFEAAKVKSKTDK
jgi:hypothetical protein